jgi:hypothetical protein
MNRLCHSIIISCFSNPVQGLRKLGFVSGLNKWLLCYIDHCQLDISSILNDNLQVLIVFQKLPLILITFLHQFMFLLCLFLPHINFHLHLTWLITSHCDLWWKWNEYSLDDFIFVLSKHDLIDVVCFAFCILCFVFCDLSILFRFLLILSDRF